MRDVIRMHFDRHWSIWMSFDYCVLKSLCRKIGINIKPVGKFLFKIIGEDKK